MRGRISPEWVVGALFALSGIAALVYQVAWQRILMLASGAGIYSVAMIVSAFMAGLGLGSHAGGVLSSRVSPRGALRAFAALEIAVGLFAAISTRLYYDWLYVEARWLYEVPWRAGVIHFAALLFPTGLMGMSLPFLTRAMVRDTGTASRTIGYLYGVNVLGAAVGAFVGPWLLMRHLGLRDAVSIGALLNFAAGLGALLLTPPGETGGIEPSAQSRWGWGPNDLHKKSQDRLPVAESEAHSFALWTSLYAASGFCALSLELVWFRLMDVSVRSSAFTFGSVLAVYLLGLGAGSLMGASLTSRLRRPLRAFLLCECALLTYAAVAIALLARTPTDFPGYRWFFDYWATGRVFVLGRSPSVAELLRLYVLLPVGLYGPPTILMGLAFAVLQRAVQTDPQTSGRKVGFLQAANIAGNVAGSLLTGLLALSVWGTAGTMRALTASTLFFAAVGARNYGARGLFGIFMATALLLQPLLPNTRELWLRLHGVAHGPALVREDATAVVAGKPDEHMWRIYVDGKSHSWVPFGGIHSWLGAVPALIHPSPRDVAVIGLGSGDTAWAAGCRSMTRHVQVFEIAAPELLLLKELGSVREDPKLLHLLSDPRVAVTLEDGRNALLREDRFYDVIVADALRPTSAGSGSLYSVEFFQSCARKLKPGGLLATWGATPRVEESFRAALPHVLHVRGGEILVGSSQPILVARPSWQKSLMAAHPYLGDLIAAEVAASLESVAPPSGAKPDRANLDNLNRDLFPRDEFLVSQREN